MFIDFNNIPVSVIPHFKDGEKEVEMQAFVEGPCRIMHIALRPGASIGMHKHEGNSEVMFIKTGRGTVIYDGAPHAVQAGMSHYCPDGKAHSLVNTSDAPLEIYAVVTQK